MVQAKNLLSVKLNMVRKKPVHKKACTDPVGLLEHIVCRCIML